MEFLLILRGSHPVVPNSSQPNVWWDLSRLCPSPDSQKSRATPVTASKPSDPKLWPLRYISWIYRRQRACSKKVRGVQGVSVSPSGWHILSPGWGWGPSAAQCHRTRGWTESSERSIYQECQSYRKIEMDEGLRKTRNHLDSNNLNQLAEASWIPGTEAGIIWRNGSFS